MAKRIVSTLLLWIVLGAVLWFFRTNGAIAFTTVVSVLTLREFYQLMHASGYDPFDKLGMIFGGLITLSPWLHAQYGWPVHSLLPCAVIVFGVRLLGERTPQNRVESLASTIVGLVYVSLMLQYMVAILTPVPGDVISPTGRLLLGLWLVATTKFCDVGALLTGMAIGRHRMCPEISPKKTWEGAIGGVVLSMATGALIAWLARAWIPAHLTPLVGALIAAPIAVLGIVSDLLESALKRRANRKDSGTTFPGIGGMFDLSDSFLLTAPAAYFLFGLG